MLVSSFCQSLTYTPHQVDGTNLPPDLQNQIVPGTRRATAKWWKMTLLFESEAMCSVACDHVERQRATMRQSKLKDVAAVMEAALTQR